MKSTEEKVLKWESRNGIVVSLSQQHKDMHIVDHPDGKFHTVSSSNAEMLMKYPIVKKIKTRISSYAGY